MFCVGFVGVVCGGVGVVVVVLVEVGFGVGLRCCTTFYKLDLRFT